MSSDGHEPRTREETAYDLVKDDVLRIFATLRVRLTHFDGSTPGDKCWGFFLGEIREASYRWHSVRERKAEVARLADVVHRLKAAIQHAEGVIATAHGGENGEVASCRAILSDALARETKLFAEAREAAGATARRWPIVDGL
jgi:hypothetical protein